MSLPSEKSQGGLAGDDAFLKWMRVATEMANEMLVVTDAAATILFANPAFEKATGFRAEDIVGRKAHSLIKVPEDIEQVRMVLELLNQGKTWEGPVTLARKEEEAMDIEVSVKPYVEGEETTHYVCCSHGHLVAQDSRKEEMKNLESLSHLANGVAHRFNNLLASVMGQTELIGMLSGENPAIMERVEKILNASQRGKEMVAQLMKFCRKQEARTRRLDFLPILKNAIRSIQEETPSDIGWDIALPESCPPMQAVSSDLNDMISHLFKNAITAMEEGGGTLQVKLDVQNRSLENGILHELDEEAPLCLHLRIKDSGMGIPESHLKYIFEPFYTTHNMATSVGMGLSIVHGVVQSHGGLVQCESRSGKGATFDVYLPVLEDNDDQQEELTGPSGHGERIVLIDNESMVTEAGANQLRELGYEVHTFSEGRPALDTILGGELGPVDLVIAEFSMPDLKGLDLVTELEMHDLEIPVLVTHSMANKRVINLVGPGVFASTLVKPCTMRELAESVRVVLEN